MNYAVQRKFARHAVRLPVEFASGHGLTRNVSVGGLYFEASEEIEEGRRFTFHIVLRRGAGEPLRLECEGTVVRVDRESALVGIAATIDNFESIAAAIR